ncbi:MAG: hypothetical protein JXQ96_12470 [Cyclobacteriaceae bacterium]
MKNEKDQELEKIINLSEQISKVDAPDSIYSGTMVKLAEEKSNAGLNMESFLQWAAVALLILVNTISYVSFLNNEDTQELATDTDTFIEFLLTEYQMDDFVYSDY